MPTDLITAAVTTTAPAAASAGTGTPPVIVLEVVAVVAFVLWRQLATRRLKDDLVKLPLILGIVGLVQVLTFTQGANVPAGAWIAFGASLLAAAAVAVPRAASLRLWQDATGAWLRRGTAATLGWWIVSFTAHVVVGTVLPRLLSVGDSSFGSAGILLYVGVTLGVQGLLLERRLDALAPGTRRRSTRPAGAAR